MDEQANLEEIFRKNLFKVRTALDWTVEYAIDRGIKNEIFAYIPKIWENDAFAIISGGDTSKNPITVSLKTAQVFVAHNQTGNLHGILHESIHRAQVLQINTRGNLILSQIARSFDLDLILKGEVSADANSYDIVLAGPGNFQSAKEKLLSIYEKFIEGITEWVVQFTNTISRQHGYALFEDTSLKFESQVEVIELIKSVLKTRGTSDHVANALFVQTALTADAQEIKKRLAGDFLKYLNEF